MENMIGIWNCSWGMRQRYLTKHKIEDWLYFSLVHEPEQNEAIKSILYDMRISFHRPVRVYLAASLSVVFVQRGLIDLEYCRVLGYSRMYFHCWRTVFLLEHLS